MSKTDHRDIAIQKQVDESYLAREKAFRKAQKLAHVGDWIWDLQNDTVTCSDEVYRIFDMAPGTSLSSERILDIVHPDDIGIYRNQIKKWRENKEGEPFAYRIITADGTVKYLWAIGEAIYDGCGQCKKIFGTVQDISERKRVENALRVSEEQLRELMEQSPVAIQIHDCDGKFVRTNQAFLHLYGINKLSLGDIYEKYCLFNDPQLIAQGLMPYIERVYEGEDVILPRFEYDGFMTLKNIDAESLTSRKCVIQARGYPLKDTEGVIKSTVFLCEDYTDRKHAEDALRNSEEQLRELMEQSPVAIQVYDPEGKLEWSNKAHANRYGLDEQAMAELHEKYNLLKDEQIKSLGMMPLIERIFNGEEVIFPRFEYTVCASTENLDVDAKDSRSHWLQSRGYPIKDPQGRVKKVVLLSEDFTSRKRMEDALQENEERLNQLIQQSPISIQVFSPAGTLTKVNNAFLKLWSIPEEFLEEFLQKYNMFEDEEALRLGVMPLIEKAFKGEVVTFPSAEYDASSTMEALNIKCKSVRKRWLQSTYYPVYNQQGQVVNVVALDEDISERMQAEQRLKALASQVVLAEEQERHRISIDLHDHVGQTLALLRLQLADVIRRSGDEGLKNELTEISQTLLQTSKETRQLIFQLGSPAMKEIGLGPAISEWAEELLKKSHSLDFELIETVDGCDDDGFTLDNDLRTMLFRNVRELLTNTAKHARASKVKVHLEFRASELRLSVHDNGTGFNPERVRGNMGSDGGFGLFSVEERMLDLGGAFEIRSAPHQGCTIIMSVPRRISCRGAT